MPRSEGHSPAGEVPGRDVPGRDVSGRSVLGRAADPAALDAEAEGCTEGLGALELTVPPGWAGRRAILRVPRAVTCRRCGGGGCDGCGRTGALRAPDDEAARALAVQLPPDLDAAVALRLPRPFGEAIAIAQLVVTFSPGPPSPRLTLTEGAAVHAGAGGFVARPAHWLVLALAVLGVVIALRALG